MKMRLARASMRRDASTSAGLEGSHGRGTCVLRTTEMEAPGTTSRIARLASPWARLRWWAAASEAAGSVRLGAWLPCEYPRNAEHQGSLSVAQRLTRPLNSVAVRRA